jgi:hypothetical protein
VNCRSVAVNAESGMLLTIATSSGLLVFLGRQCHSGLFAIQVDSRWAAMKLLRRNPEPCLTLGGGQHLVDVGDDILNVLDADGQSDSFGANTRFELDFWRQLAMGRRSGMARERLGITNIDKAGDQAKRVIEHLARLDPSFNAKGEERWRFASQILERECPVGIALESGVIDPGHARIGGKKFGDSLRVLYMPPIRQWLEND